MRHYIKNKTRREYGMKNACKIRTSTSRLGSVRNKVCRYGQDSSSSGQSTVKRRVTLWNQKNMNLLTSRATINFSRRPQVHEVRQFITKLTKLWHWILSCAT